MCQSEKGNGIMQQNHDNDRNKQVDEMINIMFEWMYLLSASDCLEVKRIITEDHINPLVKEIKELKEAINN